MAHPLCTWDQAFLCVCWEGAGGGRRDWFVLCVFFTQNIYFYCGNIYITNFTFLPIFKFSGIKDM